MADKPLKSIKFPGLPDRYVPEGGSGGTSDYNDLTNKPQIAGVTLSGNKSLADLGIAAASDIPAPEIFWAEYEVTTYAEIEAAYQAGKVVCLDDGSGNVYLLTFIGWVAHFSAVYDGAILWIKCDNQNNWTYGTEIPGTYSKPSGGIPKTDLASAVQTSLGKADTALQSFTETDPTVPAWAKSANKPTYTASEVGALPDDTAIPTKVSDLTNDSGFVNAAGAASAAPVQSVNGQTGAVTITVPSTASDVGAVASNQGVAHAGEFVVVGSDGNITTVTMTAWSGGAY